MLKRLRRLPARQRRNLFIFGTVFLVLFYGLVIYPVSSSYLLDAKGALVRRKNTINSPLKGAKDASAAKELRKRIAKIDNDLQELSPGLQEQIPDALSSDDAELKLRRFLEINKLVRLFGFENDQFTEGKTVGGYHEYTLTGQSGFWEFVSFLESLRELPNMVGVDTFSITRKENRRSGGEEEEEVSASISFSMTLLVGLEDYER